MKRRMSHALAMRSTWMPLPGHPGAAPHVARAASLTAPRPPAPPVAGRASIPASIPSTVSRPGPRRSRSPGLSESRLRSRHEPVAAGCVPFARALAARRRERARGRARPGPSDGVVGLARRGEQRLDLGVRVPFQETGLADRGLAAAGHDLAPHPLEVLEGLLARGQDVDGVLEGHGPEGLEPPADLHPQVVRLGRDLVDEEQPARLGRGRHQTRIEQLNQLGNAVDSWVVAATMRPMKITSASPATLGMVEPASFL